MIPCSFEHEPLDLLIQTLDRVPHGRLCDRFHRNIHWTSSCCWRRQNTSYDSTTQSNIIINRRCRLANLQMVPVWELELGRTWDPDDTLPLLLPSFERCNRCRNNLSNLSSELSCDLTAFRVSKLISSVWKATLAIFSRIYNRQPFQIL